MRRLVLVLAALTVLVPAGADAAKPAHLVVARGSAHLIGGNLRGWLVVANRGEVRSRPADLSVGVSGGDPPFRVKMRWTARRTTIPSLAPAQTHRVRFATPIPAGFRITRGSIVACTEDCRRIGRVGIRGPVSTPSPAPSAPGPSPESSSGPTPPSEPASPPTPITTVPTAPISYDAETPFEVTSGAVPYWAFVPDSYDPSNLTPAPLLVWLHGCGGYSEGDIWVVDPGAAAEPPQDWLTIAVGGREGGCWTPSADEAKVMAALADVETHFNVDRQRVILGGYSSGGDLAYRTGFRHSSTFSGLLVENSSPFRDTESSAAESLGAATTRPHIVHLAHSADTAYPIAGVRHEISEVEAAGFPIELIERPGAHYDGNTDSDLRELLLPHIDDGRPT